MKSFSTALISLLFASTAFAGPGSDKAAQTIAAGEVASAQAGDVVVEDWWYPLRLDSVDALSNARYYYRRDNERAAADEIRKGASWLMYAAGHALPDTRRALMGARTNLLTLADDLDTGKLAGAARLDEALAEASHALAEWHYYRARDEYGRQEMANAAQDLEAAAAHLENAATSAHIQYGPDTITEFEDIYTDGKMVSRGETVDNNLMGKHLDSVKSAVETMARTLKHPS